MKTIAVLSLVASLMTAAPVLAQSADGVCGPNGPEAYKRPGGYCEMVGANGTLALPGSGPDGAGPEEPDPCLCAEAV